MNEKATEWVYNKKFCNDIYSAVTYYKNYSYLQDEYEKILAENCKLQEIINNNGIIPNDTRKIFEILSATVINNITSLNRNYFTIDKGAKSGIKKGMSVLSAEGFVGVIANVDDYYSTIIPLLHDNFYVSAQLKNSKATGTVKWDGENLKQTRMLYVPKYIEVQVGEEIFTSGFNSSICPNLLIGTVDHIENPDDTFFHSIVVNLKNDFNTLHNVYIMSNELLKKKIELEKKTIEQYG
jgi:rod shape-determining protein MreC